MNAMDPNMKNWTVEKLKGFRAAYRRALSDKRSEFVFGGDQYLVAYAKYLIEYLDSRFGAKGSKP